MACLQREMETWKAKGGTTKESQRLKENLFSFYVMRLKKLGRAFLMFLSPFSFSFHPSICSSLEAGSGFGVCGLGLALVSLCVCCIFLLQAIIWRKFARNETRPLMAMFICMAICRVGNIKQINYITALLILLNNMCTCLKSYIDIRHFHLWICCCSDFNVYI